MKVNIKEGTKIKMPNEITIDVCFWTNNKGKIMSIDKEYMIRELEEEIRKLEEMIK